MVFAVFVLSPSLDAVTCAGEVAHAASAGADPHDFATGDASSPCSDICGHGHFHGVYALEFGQPASLPAQFVKPASYALAVAADPLAFAPGGLERPPRA